MSREDYQPPFSMLYNVVVDAATKAAGRNGILVLYAIMRHADYGTGKGAFPSNETIRKMIGFQHARPIVKAKKQLIEAGVIIVRKKRPGTTDILDVATPDAFSVPPTFSEGGTKSEGGPPHKKCTGTPPQKVTPTKSPRPKALTKSPPSVVGESFKRIWEQHPPREGRRQGKARALKYWEQGIKKGVEPEEIIRLHAQWVRDLGEQKPCDLATWLSNARWEDELVDKYSKPAKEPKLKTPAPEGWTEWEDDGK